MCFLCLIYRIKNVQNSHRPFKAFLSHKTFRSCYHPARFWISLISYLVYGSRVCLFTIDKRSFLLDTFSAVWPDEELLCCRRFWVNRMGQCLYWKNTLAHSHINSVCDANTFSEFDFRKSEYFVSMLKDNCFWSLSQFFFFGGGLSSIAKQGYLFKDREIQSQTPNSMVLDAV